MNIEIVEKKENKLLNRTEVHFRVIHEGEKTPERELVKNDLAEILKAKKGNIVLEYLKPEFGIQQSIGYAKIYKSMDDAKRIEKEYILKRNKFGAEKEKKEDKEKAEEKKEESESEKPPEQKEEQTESTEEKKNEKTKEETEEKVKEGEDGKE